MLVWRELTELRYLAINIASPSATLAKRAIIPRAIKIVSIQNERTLSMGRFDSPISTPTLPADHMGTLVMM